MTIRPTAVAATLATTEGGVSVDFNIDIVQVHSGPETIRVGELSGWDVGEEQPDGEQGVRQGQQVQRALPGSQQR